MVSLEAKRPEIAVIQTGGTIASTKGISGSIDVSTEGTKAVTSVVEQIAEELNIKIASITSPFSMDSAEMSPIEWQSLARHVKGVLNPTLDGIVITHGTDTLEYTASALSFAFPGIHLPIVITGAMRDSLDPLADGPYNLKDALFVAAYSDLAGVFAVMDSQVHDGTHVKKLSTETDQISLQHFGSLNRLPVGYVVRAKRMEFHHIFGSRSNFRSRYEALHSYTNFADDGSIVSFHHPGMNTEYMYSAFDIGAKAILLALESENLGEPMLKFTQEAVRRKVPVFAVVPMAGEIELTGSERARALRESGLIPLYDMLNTAAIVKAIWALRNPTIAKKPDVIIRRMLTNYVGEFNTDIPEAEINSFCQLYS